MSWQESVNQAVGVARINDINGFIRSEASVLEAPIDVFYRASQEILLVGTPAFLTAHSSMGPLLLVGLVSATENYFRDIFARIIQLCPLAKAHASNQNISLGSVVWHGVRDMERGAFEHLSFADVENIIKTTRKFLNYELTRTTVLAEFEKVCELRHGIVHSAAVVAGKNAVRLGIPSSTQKLFINIGFAELQECGAICNTLVASTNTELFIEMAKRWAVSWPKLPSWDPNKKHGLFSSIWNSFYSAKDAASHSIPVELSLVKCKNRVMTEFP